MAPLFGRSGTWNTIRRLLLDRGVLECDESYTIGETAKWYRLGRTWRDHRVHLETIRDRRLLAHIRGSKRRRDQERATTEPVAHLERWLQEVRVDEATLRPWTCQRERSFKQHLTALKISVLQSGQAPIVVDRYGRVHSPLTNLRRAVRPALRIHGQTLVEVDVSNAQPLILGFIVAKLLAGDWSLRQVRILGLARDLRDPFHGMGFTRWSIDLPPDLLEYLDVCGRGEFYQAVADVWGLPCESCKEKNQIKRLVYKLILFGWVRPGKPRWLAFKRRWPSVATALEQIKQGDHGRSARACQRIEARLMIQGVVERFRRDHRDQPIQTIHDSVLVVPGAVELAREAIHAEFAAIGLRPSLKQSASGDAKKATPRIHRRMQQAQEARDMNEQRSDSSRGGPANTHTSSQFAPITSSNQS
jgi:hypothetical protein